MVRQGVSEERLYGVCSALVTDIHDPFGVGRVRVCLPWLPDQGGGQYNVWARLATLAAGRNRGTWFLPEVNDEVLVAFEGGDPSRPFVLGSLWNGVDNPPAANEGGSNDHKALRARSGVEIVIDDQEGAKKLSLRTPAGQQITLDDESSSIQVTDAHGSRITLSGQGVVIDARGAVTVTGSTISCEASSLTFDAGLAVFSGVVKADTVMCNAVVSQSYSPGSGKSSDRNCSLVEVARTNIRLRLSSGLSVTVVPGTDINTGADWRFTCRLCRASQRTAGPDL
jgi:phage baseplate assembly protein gpV